MWCVPELTDEYIERMEDVLAIYERPYDSWEPVVCLDEKPVPLRDDVRPTSRANDASLRRDAEYRRCGTANLFGVVEPKGGRHFTRVTKNRDRFEFAKMMRLVERAYPIATKIHLILDNASTHSRKAVVDMYGEREAERIWSRFEVHYTPKHGSWLNQAEIELSLISRECMGSSRFSSARELRKRAGAWNRDANRNRRTIEWRFTRRKARATFGYDRPRSRG